jgi:hypothetical protein
MGVVVVGLDVVDGRRNRESTRILWEAGSVQHLIHTAINVGGCVSISFVPRN